MQRYGGFWIRVLAYIIDSIILQFVSTILMMVFFGVGFGLSGMASGGGNEAAISIGLVIFYLATFVISWLYFALLESSSWQGTVGKKGLGLIVTDEDGEQISFGRATGRYFGKIISSIIIGIGFLMVGWTQRKQGLHDIMAGTLVHKASAPELVRNSARIFD